MRRILATAVMALGLGGGAATGPAHAQADPILGQMMTVGFNFCPRGWAEAAGQLLPISQNTALFSLLGCTYGGDCRTTFALPDLRGRSAVGVGRGAGLNDITWGERGGRTDVTLNATNLPSHNHTGVLKGAEVASNTSSPTGAALAQGGIYAGRTSPNVDLAGGSVTIDNTGGNQPFNIRNPYLGMHNCIAMQGIFPSRP